MWVKRICGKVVHNQKYHASEDGNLESWHYNATWDGGDKAILLFSKTAPKLLHLLFASSPAWIAFRPRLQRRTESLSQGFKPFRRPHQPVAKTILCKLRRRWNSDQEDELYSMMTCCATIEAFIVSQGGRCGGTSVSNADLGVTERGIACQETPTLQPPPPSPSISFSQTSTHPAPPPTPGLVVARLPFNLIICASNILLWEYCLSHFQIFARHRR